MNIPVNLLIIRISFCLLTVFIATDTHAAGNSVSSDAFNTDGPWAFRNSPGNKGGKTVYIDTTQSKESSDVWLGFTCGEDRRIFASILDQSGFPVAVGDDVSVEITLDYSATPWNATAKKTSETILTFNPKFSNDLFTYAIHAQALTTTFLNNDQAMQTHSFRLQPNSMAFRGIIVSAVLRPRP